MKKFLLLFPIFFIFCSQPVLEEVSEAVQTTVQQVEEQNMKNIENNNRNFFI